MVNRYTQLRPYEFDLYKPDLNVLNSTLGILQKRFDTNKLFADQLKNTLIDALPQDRGRANELQQKYAQQIDNVVAAYKGDYSKATSSLYEVQSAMRKDFGKGGEASAIQGNYNSFLDWNKRQQERLEKKEIAADDYNQGRNYFLQNFKGTGTQNEYGAFNDINNGLQEIAETVDPNDVIKPIFDTIKPQKYKKQRTVFHNGLQTDVTEAHEGVAVDRLDNAFEQGLRNNPKLQAHLQQKLMFQGQDPSKASTYLSQYAAARARELAYDNIEDLQKSDRDPLALAKYNQDRQDKRQKDQNDFEQRFQFDPTINNVTPYKPIDDGLLNKTYNWWNNPFFGSGAGGYNRAASDKAISDAKTNGKTLEDILDDKELVQEKGIMPQLVRQYMQSTIEALNPNQEKAYNTYSDKYGKDKEWTKNFDKQVIDAYNNDIKNHSRVAPISMVIPFENGGKEIMTSTYSAIKNNPSQVEVFEIGTNKFMRADEAGFTGEELLMDKTSSANGTQVSQDVRYMVPQPFIPQGGLVASKNGRQYVIVDQDEERYMMNKRIGDSFSNIYSGDQHEGSPFQISQTKDAHGHDVVVTATPRLRFDDTPDGRKSQRITYQLKYNGQEETNPKTGEPIEREFDSISRLYQNMDFYKKGLYKKLK